MDAALVELSSLSSDDIRKMQQTLKDRGAYQGEVDGKMGPKTRAALTSVVSQQFALNQRLINQGRITGQLAESVGINAQGISPVSGVDSDPMGSQPSPSPQQGQQGSSPSPSDPSQPVYPEGTQNDSDMDDSHMDHNAPQAPR
jgi:peptidoglycan hydrolase-like protein with peptidoglycan-binding domain